MASLHPVWTELVGFELNALERPRAQVKPGWSARARARLLAHRMDRHVDAGTHVQPGSALAAHHHRLTTRRERADVARRLHLLLRDAVEGPDVLIPRVPVRTPEVLRFRGVIEDVGSHLGSFHPVRARGMARLRMLLADGRGPLYRTNAGSLNAALRGVLAAL